MKYKYFILSSLLLCISSIDAKSIVTGYGRTYSAKMDIQFPSTVNEVQRLVKAANAEARKVNIVGAGMSQGEQYLFANSTLIDLKEMKEMYLEGTLLTVQAGALWSDVHAYINERGLALQVMQGSNIFSVGGSLSVNCHGWDFRKGSIDSTVEEITIINANGDLQTLCPNDELFSYVIGGYGCFGIITEAKIRLTKNLPIKEMSQEVKLEDYLEYFHQHIENSDSVAMHHYRLDLDTNNLYKSGVVTDFLIQDTKPIASKFVPDRANEGLVKTGMWLARNLPFTKPFLWKIAKSKMLKDKDSTRNLSMAPPVDFHFLKKKGRADWLQEFFVPEENLMAFLDFLQGVLKKNDVLLYNTTVRYVKAQPNKALAYTPNKDRFAIVLFFEQSLSPKKMQQTEKWVKEVIDYLIAHDGIYYLPYHTFATYEQFQACYPNYHQFKRLKEQTDPNLTFYSGFYAHYLDSPTK